MFAKTKALSEVSVYIVRQKRQRRVLKRNGLTTFPCGYRKYKERFGSGASFLFNNSKPFPSYYYGSFDKILDSLSSVHRLKSYVKKVAGGYSMVNYFSF